MTTFDQIPFFYLLLPVIAFLYAAVGHGGASGYLALMILFAFPESDLKSTALILNICVSAISFWNYYKKGHFNFHLFLLVGIISIPAAYFGGQVEVEDDLFKKLLGVFLLIAVFKLLGIFNLKRKENDVLNPPNIALALVIGASIGFLSGLLGIGGGILLTPILLFLRWTSLKQAAGISALFIFANSVAGLQGLISVDKLIVHPDIGVMILCVIVGGFLGGYLGSSKMNNTLLRYLLAGVLLIATYKLFFG
ncbi:MAG: sulfite exporter TauE/SafE family protein [Crocinitomicaceae bacterium]|nr:sulfite exporter TauE/SafE family protein [Crocinitomicaceae bacterium]